MTGNKKGVQDDENNPGPSTTTSASRSITDTIGNTEESGAKVNGKRSEPDEEGGEQPAAKKMKLDSRSSSEAVSEHSH